VCNDDKCQARAGLPEPLDNGNLSGGVEVHFNLIQQHNSLGLVQALPPVRNANSNVTHEGHE
jgi:hypothetical protein